MIKPPIALTIAGSDPSGGAGLQADLKTFHQHGTYGTTVVTLLTVQNTRSVSRVQCLEPDWVAQQLDAVLSDVPPGAAKTGALGSAALVELIAARAATFEFPLVVDPVMISKHGAPLLDADAQHAMRALLPHATLLTPNTPEASALCGREVQDKASAIDAGRALCDMGARAVLIKGGHLEGQDAVDFLVTPDGVEELRAKRIDTVHTHGTGCTLSAAITARLAQGTSLGESVRLAKAWLTDAIATAPGIGGGQGPLNHLAPLPQE